MARGPVRPALFAARGWYPRDPAVLGAFMDEACEPAGSAPAAAIAVVSPHAGYRFSGAVAGAAFARVTVPDTVVVVGIGHRPAARPNVVGTRGAWASPGGELPIDEALADDILAASPHLEEDGGELAVEHSQEMQIPFLQHRNPGARIVPVQVRELTRAGCLAVGEAIAGVIATRPAGSVLLLASTHLHHQEKRPGIAPEVLVPALDARCIERLEALDPEGLHDTVRAEGIGMCGVLPTTVVLAAARRLGAEGVQVVRHATSYDISGEDGYVVGYVSAIVR